LKSLRAWNIIGFTAGYIVLIEGLIVFILAGPATISRIGSVSASTMQTYGFILAALALVPILFSTVESYIQFSDARKKLMAWIFTVVVCIFGVAISILGILTAINFGSVTTERFGTIPVYVMAVIAGQLFFLGLIIAITKLQAHSDFNVTKLIAFLFGIAIASEGVVILGISASTYIEGLGWILKRTVDLAGIQLMVVGLLFLTFSILSERIKRGNKVMGFLKIVTAAIATIEGFAIMALSTPVTIEGIGTITARTITIAGAQLGILGLGCLIILALGSNLATPRLRKVSNLTFVFLLLLIPIAALSSTFTF
jgi:hypothetical protein